MKRLIVDMDGVLADVYANFIRIEKERYGWQPTPDSLTGIKEEEAFPHFEEIVNSEGFFRCAPIMDGCVERLEKLNALYDVRIVSSATEFPASLREKFDWLREHFPFISWKQMTFGGSKDLIAGDIMLDDHLFNLRGFEGEKVLFTQPHNILNREKYYKRADDWAEIMRILG